MKELKYPRLGERCFWEKLPNGLKICVIPKPGFQKSFAFFATQYGGEDECFLLNGHRRQTPAGVAHFLEHKMFDLPEGNALQELSARGASPNAFTSTNLTGYYFTCTDGFYENLRTLLTFVTTPFFTQESVAKEQGIIAQEIRMIQDNPDWQLYNGLMESLFLYHTSRNNVAGTVESISRITPKVLTDCHKTFYHPSNMVLCVAGNVDPRRVSDLAMAHVPDSKPRTLQRDHGAEEHLQPAQGEIVREKEVSAPSFYLGFKADPQSGQRRLLVGELAAELLAGESSPLYARLYQQGLIDKSFGVSYTGSCEAPYFAFGGESSDPAAVTEAILNEALRIVWNGADEKLLRRLQRAAYGSRVRALNSFEHCCIQTTRAAFDGYAYFDFAALYDSITAQEITELIQSSVTGERAALSIVTPKRS